MQINRTADMRTSKGIAMAIAPFDTGNLRFNAIKGIMTNKGFRIRYSLDNAFYIYFLEEGTKYSRSNVGFIANDTVPTIASYLYAKYASKNRVKTNRFKYVARQAQNDMEISEQRTYRNERSLALDLEKVSNINKWEHKPTNEIYDPDFMERSL